MAFQENVWTDNTELQDAADIITAVLSTLQLVL